MKQTKSTGLHCSPCNPEFIDKRWFKWTQTNLPSSKTGYSITDIDAVIRWNETSTGIQHVMLLERKNKMAEIAPVQSVTLDIIDFALKFTYQTHEKRAEIFVNNKLRRVPVRYYGLHLLQVQETDINQARRFFFDSFVVNLKQVINILSFKLKNISSINRHRKQEK